MKTESAKKRPLFCPLRAYLVAGCVIIQRSREKRAESKKTAFARACALQPSHRVQPNRARIIRGRAFYPRLRVRPIACARCPPRYRELQQKKKQFCGLVPGLQPVKTAGALHPSAAEKNGRKNSPPWVMVHSCSRGHHLRPASLAELASACARVRALGCGRFCL